MANFVYLATNKLRQLTENQYVNNAWAFKEQMEGYGWTINAICGALGNIDHESQINPGQWQSGYPVGSKSAGFGLPQFTPSKKYTDFAKQKGRDIYSGYWQCYTIDKQDFGIEWTPKGIMSYSDFKKSTAGPEYLAEVFMKCYERPGKPQLASRQAYARKWYDYFGGAPTPPDPPEPPEPQPPDIHSDSNFNLLFYCLRRKGGI